MRVAVHVLDEKPWNGSFGTPSMVNKKVFDPIGVEEIRRVVENMKSDASLTTMGSFMVGCFSTTSLSITKDVTKVRGNPHP